MDRRTATYQLPPDVRAALGSLRGAIRRYVLWEGLALLIATALLLFWVSWLADWGVFAATRLELPRWLRGVFVVSACATLAAAAFMWLLLRLVRGLPGLSLALVLERRFPELSDRLVTAIEAAEGRVHATSPATQQMLLRTIEEAAVRTRQLNLAEVFDAGPIRRATTAAGVLVASLAILAVVNWPSLERWNRAFVLLADDYWDRQTILQVQALNATGETLRDFQDHQLHHARGADLVLVISALPGKQVPTRVRLDYRFAGGRGTGRAYLVPSENGTFRHTIPELLDSATLWVTGGDYTNSEPYEIRAVPSPTLDRLALHCRYPDYTGLNEAVGAARDDSGRTIVPVEGLQVAVPLGTDVLWEATFSQPVSAVRCEVESNGQRFDVELERHPDGRSSGRLTLKANDGGQQQRRVALEPPPEGFWSIDGKRARIRWLVSPTGMNELAERCAKLGGDQLLTGPIPSPGDAVWRVHSLDTMGIASLEPSRVALRAIADEPPLIETNVQGIGLVITRQARIPVAGRITDDYGIASARFDYRVDASEEWKPQDFARPPLAATAIGRREFELARTEETRYERFDVLPLDLNVGQTLTLVVAATDGDTVTGPHEARSQKHVFKIVTVEELLSQLYSKELNLRRRFEQLLEELRTTNTALQQVRGVATELDAARSQTNPPAGFDSVSATQTLIAATERALYDLRQSATESSGVEQAFRDIREELVNNAAETPQILDRLDSKILAPLSTVNTISFAELDQSLGLLRLALDRTQAVRPGLDVSLTQLEGLIGTLERILLEMRKLETFQEAVELLKGIMGGVSDLQEKTRTRRKEKLIQALDE